MAILHPFRALRPITEIAQEVASVPYDVVSSSEARRLAHGKPLSFLHVIRPEIDLPEGTDEHDAAVYEKGAENLRNFVDSPNFLQEKDPALYIYRLIMDGRSQTGIFGCVAVADYDNDIILKHEKTRQDKEDDRTRHILTQSAHAEPVMLTYRGDASIDSIVAEAKQQKPVYDFIAEDTVQHSIWKVENPSGLVKAFRSVNRLYVADGHHRCKAASRSAEQLRGPSAASGEEFEYFPAVIFPMEEMMILPYNRIVYQLPVDAKALIDRMKDAFGLRNHADPVPSAPGNVSFYLNGAWYAATLPATNRKTVADTLDVSRLSEFVLEPILGISDPRRDPNLSFVGGIRGTQELERLVDSGAAALAISMYPTSIEELIQVSDAGLLMPPKSTWFEPKLRSGLLVHLF